MSEAGASHAPDLRLARDRNPSSAASHWRDGSLHRRAARARGPRQWEAALRGFLSRASRKSGA